MSLNFKTELKEMRENDPAGEDAFNGDYKASENYDTPGHVRNLCFVWPDGRMKFINYGYLISGEYRPLDGSINLAFTSCLILIKGLRLESLFFDLLSQMPLKLKCFEERYNDLLSNTDFVINSVNVTEI